MANKRSSRYKFKIQAYSPETMPLRQLLDYLSDLNLVLGESTQTHLVGVIKGSTAVLIAVDPEAEAKIRLRLKQVETGDAPPKTMDAIASINHRLRLDGASGTFIDPSGDNLLFFPGAKESTVEYGPFNQAGTIDGIPHLIGGMQDPVPIHLIGRRGERYNCLANRLKAKEIAQYLFTHLIRAEGTGRWLRTAEGEWEMRSFRINTFTSMGLVADLSLKTSIEELRAIPAKWKELDDPIGDLMHIRDDVEM